VVSAVEYQGHEQGKPYAGMAIGEAIRAVDARVDQLTTRQCWVERMCAVAVLMGFLAVALAAWGLQ
jgi:hypothetical protein